jgi:hypothetical protein
VKEIARFFKTGRPPVSAAETIEIYAFMEAADESKWQGGAPVTIESVIDKARKMNTARRQTAKDEPKDEFVSLFNGKDFSGWRFGASSALGKLPKNWSVGDGLIKLAGGGSPHLASQWDYDDFEASFEWRAHKKGYNSGFYVRSGRDVGANQINLAESDCGHLIGSSSKGGPKVPELQKPVGEWNEWRVRAVGSKLTFWSNGKLAWEVNDFKPARGYLGLQAEGAPIDFRNIRVKEIGWLHTAEAPINPNGTLFIRGSADCSMRVEWKAKTGAVVYCEKTVIDLATSKVLNPDGQWNYLEVTLEKNKLTVRMNGADIGSGNLIGEEPRFIGLHGEGLMAQNLRTRLLK